MAGRAPITDRAILLWLRWLFFLVLSFLVLYTYSEHATLSEIWMKVGWTASGGQYLSCKDTGPGIPEEELPIVLASFGQGSNSIKSAEQGAGLGLPIAKSLVDLHKGTFTLKSKLRIGTEVIVTFPPERVMAALAPLAEPAPSIAPKARGESGKSPPAPTSPERQRPMFRLGV